MVWGFKTSRGMGGGGDPYHLLSALAEGQLEQNFVV